jgi:hypothetical protein
MAQQLGMRLDASLSLEHIFIVYNEQIMPCKDFIISFSLSTISFYLNLPEF